MWEIEISRIVSDAADCRNFVERLGELAVDTGTSIHAWALTTNHAHRPVRRSEMGIFGFMPRLLTGFVVSDIVVEKTSGDRP